MFKSRIASLLKQITIYNTYIFKYMQFITRWLLSIHKYILMLNILYNNNN